MGLVLSAVVENVLLCLSCLAYLYKKWFLTCREVQTVQGLDK